MAAYSSMRPPSVEEALTPLLRLSDGQMQVLISATTGPRSFSLPKDEIDSLRGELGTTADSVSFMLAAFSFLYAHVRELTEDGIPFEEAVRETIEGFDPNLVPEDARPALQIRLVEILRRRDVHERSRKIERLRAGFVPNAVGFSTLVDLRPSFDDESDEMTITGYIASTLFRINTDALSPLSRRMVFQVSEEGLRDMRKAIDRAEKKIKALRTQTSFSSMLIDE